MRDRALPKLAKWPFYLGDGLLVLAAVWIVNRSPHPLGPWPLLFLVLGLAAGAWVCAAPFILEYRAALRFAEADSLTTALEQMRNLQRIGDQITVATAQWQTVQEHCAATTVEAKQIAERLTSEAQAFANFLQKANDSEKGHLRLEVEKMRRTEGDWLEVMIRVLDHVHALHQAGVRSGQSNLQQQLTQFQSACRDSVRRIGLVPLEAQAGEPFDERRHQLLDPQAKPPAEALVEETIATGYSFQGQLLRRCLVNVKRLEPSALEPDDGTFHLDMLDDEQTRVSDSGVS